jgi:hypothetical protein
MLTDVNVGDNMLLDALREDSTATDHRDGYYVTCLCHPRTLFG